MRVPVVVDEYIEAVAAEVAAGLQVLEEGQAWWGMRGHIACSQPI